MANLGVYYEHPVWFEPLFRELDRRGVHWMPVLAQDYVFDPADLHAPAPVMFNRLAMSSFLRQAEHAIFHALAAISHWELAGARVINGSRALHTDTSKARQLSVFRSLGLSIPRTRVVHRCDDIVVAAAQIGFPLVVKPNIGGSGSGIARFDSLDELHAKLADGRVVTAVDGVTLVQDYVPARDGRVIRCEILNGRFLYAIALNGAGSTFDLCPADVCMVDKPTIVMEAYRPSAEIVTAVESIARSGSLDVAGIEYVIDDRDGIARFYDINALSNFVAKPQEILGWDPHVQLVDFIVETIGQHARAQ